MTYKKGLTLTINNKKFTTRSYTQTEAVENVLNNTITFFLGGAGVGKSYIAVSTALHYLFERKVERIILARPAVEAGENLGFLPGDLHEKIAPYMFPLYDALDDFLGKAKRENMVEKGLIEVLPLAYMRGRTLSNAFVILDEAQNATKTQMKMALTRIGTNTKVVVNGDQTQNDLPRFTESGLMDAVHRLEGKKSIAVTRFGTEDVVRHPVVKTVIEAYQE